MMERKPGYYWIRLGHNWLIAEWHSDAFRVLDGDQFYWEGQIDEVGNYIPEPGEKA